MAPTGRRSIAAIATLASAVALSFGTGIAPAEAASSSGVATTTVNIRGGASTSASLLGRLVRGQKITVTGHATGDWVKVRFRGATAYMDGEYLDRTGARPAAPTTLPTAGSRIATAELNIRSGPGARHRVVSELPDGSAIAVTGRYVAGYAEFRHRGTLRWVSAAYLAESLDGTAAAPPGASPIAAPAPVSGTTRGEIALAFGRAQLGEPYVFGATGPNRWDCSGLTQAAWRAAGISIPRTTYTQVRIGQRVARTDLRLGDLVFFYGSRPSHVGLYAGNGMVLNAPRPGKTVSYSRISSMPYAGAVRPG